MHSTPKALTINIVTSTADSQVQHELVLTSSEYTSWEYFAADRCWLSLSSMNLPSQRPDRYQHILATARLHHALFSRKIILPLYIYKPHQLAIN